jgi:hypothetical protein
MNVPIEFLAGIISGLAGVIFYLNSRYKGVARELALNKFEKEEKDAEISASKDSDDTVAARISDRISKGRSEGTH